MDHPFPCSGFPHPTCSVADAGFLVTGDGERQRAKREIFSCRSGGAAGRSLGKFLHIILVHFRAILETKQIFLFSALYCITYSYTSFYPLRILQILGPWCVIFRKFHVVSDFNNLTFCDLYCVRFLMSFDVF